MISITFDVNQSKPVGKAFKEACFISLMIILNRFTFFALPMCIPQFLFKGPDQFEAVEFAFLGFISIF